MARHGRHGGTRVYAGRAVAMAAAWLAGLALAGTAAFMWFAPAGTVPLPKTTLTCTVVSGGTLRIHTSECGTLLVRGRVDLRSGETVDAVTTGPVAWSVEPADGGRG